MRWDAYKIKSEKREESVIYNCFCLIKRDNIDRDTR